MPPGTQSGRRLRLRGRGLPRGDGSRGDLYAVVRIVVPERPSAAERDGLRGAEARRVGPGRPAGGSVSAHADAAADARERVDRACRRDAREIYLSGEELAAAAGISRAAARAPGPPRTGGAGRARGRRVHGGDRGAAAADAAPARDLGVSLAGAAIIVDLLERLERLEARAGPLRGGP